MFKHGGSEDGRGYVLGQTEEPAGAEGFGLLRGAVLGGDLEEFADGGGIGLGGGAVCHEEGNGGDLLTGGGRGGGAAGGIEEGLAGQFALAITGKVAGGGRGGSDVEEVGE